MTLNDLERQNRGFYGFFGDFRLRDTLQERFAPKPIEIDMDKLHIKFSELNENFDGPSLDFLGSRKPAHEGIKVRYSRKSHDEMAGDRLTVCKQELLYAFARPVSISSNFLLMLIFIPCFFVTLLRLSIKRCNSF